MYYGTIHHYHIITLKILSALSICPSLPPSPWQLAIDLFILSTILPLPEHHILTVRIIINHSLFQIDFFALSKFPLSSFISLIVHLNVNTHIDYHLCENLPFGSANKNCS